MFRNIAIGVAVLAVAVFAIVQLFKVQIGERMFTRAIEQNIGTSAADDLVDGLHVGLCGAGSPLPDLSRSGPCTIVLAGEKVFVVDIGSGGTRNIGSMRLPVGSIEAIFLTHFHSDHIDGLGELLTLRWVQGNHTEPVPVHGPIGVTQVVEGFNAAYRLDGGYRTAHHGADIVPPSGAGGAPKPFSAIGLNGSVEVYNDGSVTVTAFGVDHSPIEPAVGYRIDYKGRSVVISGDTVKHQNIIDNAQGADLLVHESLNAEWVGKMKDVADSRGLTVLSKIMHDILDYHATPIEAAETATEAGVSHLVLHHVVPPVPAPFLNPYYLKGTRDAFNGPITLGVDGMLFSLPAGSEDIDVTSLF